MSLGQVRSAASSAPPRTVRDVRFTDSFKEAGIQDVVILGLKAGGAKRQRMLPLALPSLSGGV